LIASEIANFDQTTKPTKHTQSQLPKSLKSINTLPMTKVM